MNTLSIFSFQSVRYKKIREIAAALSMQIRASNHLMNFYQTDTVSQVLFVVMDEALTRRNYKSTGLY